MTPCAIILLSLIAFYAGFCLGAKSTIPQFQEGVVGHWIVIQESESVWRTAWSRPNEAGQQCLRGIFQGHESARKAAWRSAEIMNREQYSPAFFGEWSHALLPQESSE